MITLKQINIEKRLYLWWRSIVKITWINNEYWNLPWGVYCFLSNKQTLSLSYWKSIKVDINNFMWLKWLQEYIANIVWFISQ